MRRVLAFLLAIVPLAPLSFAFIQTKNFIDAGAVESSKETRRLVLNMSASLSEPLLSQPSRSRTELHELGRRIDALDQVDSVLLVYRAGTDAERRQFELGYSSEGAQVAQSADWDELLFELTSNARSEAAGRLGDITERLDTLGRAIVDVVMQGGAEETQRLQRLDDEFKRLYDEGNRILLDLSEELQVTVQIPTGGPGGEMNLFHVQPVLSFARSRTVEVLGVVLLHMPQDDPDPLARAFLLRLGAALLLAFALYVVRLVLP